jgi:transcriptional regulator with XRE-family HTH domain
MSTKTDPAFLRSFDRQMLRSAFQSLFWSVFSDRKRKGKMTQQQFADALGVDKSAVSRSFSIPQNWTIDKLADMARVLGVELVVEARDVAASGVVFTANGVREVVPAVTTNAHVHVFRGAYDGTIISAKSGIQSRIIAQAA